MFPKGRTPRQGFQYKQPKDQLQNTAKHETNYFRTQQEDDKQKEKNKQTDGNKKDKKQVHATAQRIHHTLAHWTDVAWQNIWNYVGLGWGTTRNPSTIDIIQLETKLSTHIW